MTVGKGGDRVLTESATYFAKYRDAVGVVVTRSTGCRDKQAAEQVLKKWEREAEQIKAGTLDGPTLKRELDGRRWVCADDGTYWNQCGVPFGTAITSPFKYAAVQL